MRKLTQALRNASLGLGLLAAVGCATVPKGYSVIGDKGTSKQEIVRGMNKFAGFCTGTARVVEIESDFFAVYRYKIKGFYFPFLDGGKALKRVYKIADGIRTDTAEDRVVDADEFSVFHLEIIFGSVDPCFEK